MTVSCSFMDLIFVMNQHIADSNDAEQLERGYSDPFKTQNVSARGGAHGHS
jgi:hypothetical protein